ncbi:MAG TPA: hypothetical protein VNK04_21955 [Gemmataceae bacterium]|nr:hypothetical protein [Gemmataceae bacterium]
MLLPPVLMLGLFAFTLFLSATLLFLVQPMIGKMMLPHLGGTPAVWNTCMVFFQAVLLLGYAYAHATTTWLSLRARILLHAVVLLIPVVVLPISVAETWAPRADANPVPAVLGLLFITAGLPFFVVSTSAPLLQKWFASTGHPAARDPYFLYGASNLGSMLALVAYPALVEPHFNVAQQSVYWSLGYGALAVLTLGCAALVWTSGTTAPAEAEGKKEGKWAKLEPGPRGSTGITPPPPLRPAPARPGRRPRPEPGPRPLETAVTPLERLHWVALAFVPSSLMLGATTYITTDVAAIPLLWVLPLGLYLLSFILVFSRLPGFIHKAMVVALPLLLLLLVFMMMSNIPGRSFFFSALVWKIGIHLLVLFVAAMVCHGELARRRPSTSHLTEYYLLMSVGGVLGGVFNALVAPLIFTSVGIVEYPLAMILALMLLPRDPNEDKSREAFFKDFGYPAALGVLSLILISGLILIQLKLHELRLFVWEDTSRLDNFLENYGEQIEGAFAKIIRYGVPVVLCYLFVDRPLRLALGVGAILLAHGFVERANNDIIRQERSFFGVLKVEEEGQFRKLVHGTTLHGTQRYRWDNRSRLLTVRTYFPLLASADPSQTVCYWAAIQDEWVEPTREALTYYHRTGPMGQIMREFRGPKRKEHYAVIGLGTGSMASFAEAGQKVTFYDIDKAVKEIATDPRYFTYVSDARERGAQVEIVLGDARVRLKEEIQDEKNERHHHRYGLLVIDAFSSDAIPMHLITKEAVEIYLKKLADDGVLVFHISNRHLNLEPVLANLAEAVEPPLVGYVQTDGDDDIPEKAASTWVIMARKKEDFGGLLELKRASGKPRWEPLEDKKNPAVGVWTDHFSNILKVFHWR